jgi:endonuclease/exonuclease/phosphatase family metal-dependent hydrolase
MPLYSDLNPAGKLAPEWGADEGARQRTVSRLLGLRQAFSSPNTPGAPPDRSMGTLLLATWNLREFDSATWGTRLPESYAYIAEVIDRFDLVAVQEVREDLAALEALRHRLGVHWQYLVSDVTEGRAGNRERLAFLFDTRKVKFLGIAGELVLPPQSATPAQQIARTPLMAAFQVGWTKFVLATVHIIYGDDIAEPVARVEEISEIAKFLRDRSEEQTEPVRNFILLGDFNIFASTDKTMQALTDGGFTVPIGMQSVPGSNVPKDKKYDQIAYRAREGRFEATGKAGAFDYYEHVMTDAEEAIYRPYINAYIDAQHEAGKESPKKPTTNSARLTQFRTWRTYQLSDHLPLWAEFRVDFSDEYLGSIAAAQPAP